MSAATDGAVKVGFAAVALLSVAVGPAVWDQAQVRVWLSGSRLALPSRVTVSPSVTVWSAPALAVGAVLTWTATCTVSAVEARPSGSVTVRLKVRTVVVSTSGAVKVGFATFVLERVTGGPPGCVQA